MKKVIVIILAAILILGVTACGGTAIEDQGLAVETKAIAEVQYTGMGDEELPFVYGQILDIMEDAEAQFFYIEWRDNDYDAQRGPLTIYQTDKATLDKIAEEGVSLLKESKGITSDLADHFNQDCEKITEGKQQGSTYYNCWYTAPRFTSSNDMMSVYDYYKENGLVLSSENWVANKVGIHKQMDGNLQYLFVCEGDITTVSKTNDIFRLLPSAGESKHQVVKCSSTCVGKSGCSLENIYLN